MNTSVLPLNRRNILLDTVFRKVVLWNNELILNINLVIFPSDVENFATSLNLKSDMLVFDLLKME